MTKTTIIIPVFNNLNYTKNCIDSIYENTDINSFSLIIVDNASTDGTADYLKSLKNKYGNFEFIINNTNYGFAKANNQAVEIVKTEQILFLNNDTKVTKGWLDYLDSSLNFDESIKITGSKLLYEDGTIQHAGIVISKFSDANRKIIYHLYRLFDAKHQAVNKSRFFQALTGACLLTYRDFFIELGGFDENYQNGFEDIDLCLKAGEKQAKIFYCPESVVYHYESKTPGRHNNTHLNTDFFYKKWNDKLISDDYKYYFEDGFNLINVQREWKILNSDIKQEYLDIVFEKNLHLSETLIIFKTDNNLKEYILQLEINTSIDFSLLLFSDNNEKINLEKIFHQVNFKSVHKFSLDNLLEYLLINQYKNVIFADSGSLYYQWDKNANVYSKEQLSELFQRIKTKNIDNNDLSLIEVLSEFFDDLELILALNKIYTSIQDYKKSIKHLEKAISKYPMNKSILKSLAESLFKSGDQVTSEKIIKIIDMIQ